MWSTIRVEDLSPTEIAEIHVRILEGGRQLVLLIGKDFPVADEVWPEVNKFHQLIDGCKLNDTWVTVITPDEREVSDFALAFCLSFSLLLILYFVDCSAGNHRLSRKVVYVF